jgi:hypothetical protein
MKVQKAAKGQQNDFYKVEKKTVNRNHVLS